MKKLKVIISVNLMLLFISFYSTAQQNINKQLITGYGQTLVDVSPAFSSCTKDKNLGNCATIALIKTAFGQFKAMNAIYKKVEINKDSIYMIFNDGIVVSFSKSEIDTAKKYSGIKKLKSEAYFDSAMIVFSSICKRVLVNKSFFQKRHELDANGFNNADCVQTFRDAVDYVDSGYPTASVGDFLGLTLEEVPLNKIKDEAAIIINDYAHAAYCSFGEQDIEGESYIINQGRMENPKRSIIGIKTGRITGAFLLKK